MSYFISLLLLITYPLLNYLLSWDRIMANIVETTSFSWVCWWISFLVYNFITCLYWIRVLIVLCWSTRVKKYFFSIKIPLACKKNIKNKTIYAGSILFYETLIYLYFPSFDLRMVSTNSSAASAASESSSSLSQWM